MKIDTFSLTLTQIEVATVIFNIILALFNLNRFGEITLSMIPSSRTGRYTMEFWIYVEGFNVFSSGVNIIFENHISISLINDSTNDSNLIAYCLPQAYRDKVMNKSGAEMVSVYNKASNKATDTYINSMSTWIFVKCAYDHNREIYYLNNLTETKVNPETTLNGSVTATPYKYFGTRYVSVFLQNFSLNYTRIFMRVLNIYRDYIPKAFDFRWR